MNFKKYMFNLIISLLLIVSYMGNYGYFHNQKIGMADSTRPNVQVASEVPEPVGALLMTLGGIIWHRRQKRKP